MVCRMRLSSLPCSFKSVPLCTVDKPEFESVSVSKVSRLAVLFSCRKRNESERLVEELVRVFVVVSELTRRLLTPLLSF